jgi:HEAT repeat protein
MLPGYAGKQVFLAMAVRNVEAQLEQLSRLRTGTPAESAAPLRKALADRVNLVVAKAATIAGELLIRDLEPELVRAFERLLEDPVTRDPQCWGKNAIAKALKELDHRESAVFLRGARHVQMEPVWGGQEDTAGPLRGICLLALVACTDLKREEILRHLVNALTESAAPVRVDAARALAQMGGEEGALLLRLKARIGDRESSVTGQALEGLLALERKEALPFVAGFLSPKGGEIAEEAALALGASRMAAAVEMLREVWGRTVQPEFRAVLLRALCISRDEQALAFLEDLAKNGREQDAADALAALAMLHSGARNG